MAAAVVSSSSMAGSLHESRRMEDAAVGSSRKCFMGTSMAANLKFTIRRFSSARGLRPESLEEKWHRFFDDPSLWWDNRANNWHGPDFKNVSTGEGLRIDSCPEWVRLKLNNLNTPGKSEKGVKAQYKKSQKPKTKTQPSDDYQYCNEIQQGTAKVNVSILLSALKECKGPTDFQKVKMVHQATMESNQISNIYVANSLVNTYAKCRCMSEARRVFDRMRRRTSVTWNALMFGYVENGEAEAALELFERMEQKPDARSFLAAVKACTSLALKEEAREVDGKLVKVESLNKGMSIHTRALDNGHGRCMLLASSLVDLYAKCGRMDKALEVFNEMESRNTVSWTALMFGYVENGDGELALKLFMRMKTEGCAPDDLSFVAALKACTSLAMKENGKMIAGRIVKQASLEKGTIIHNQALNSGYGSNIQVRNTLISMYGKCGNSLEARIVFDAIPNPNTVSWTAMIKAYTDNGLGDQAIQLLNRMRREGCTPNTLTFQGLQVVSTGDSVKGVRAQEGEGAKGKTSETQPNEYCNEIQQKTDKVGVLLSALKECKGPTDFEKVKMVHQAAIESSQISSIYVANSLVNSYAKCGGLSAARRVFDGMSRRTSVTWNALMFGYVEHGEPEAALELFARMEQKPDARSFVAAVKACTSLALKEEAREVDGKLVKVESLNKGMSIQSQALDNSHGGFMFLASSLVDMYAKCGRMDKALELLNKMEPHDTVAWTALMFGYVENGDGELALNLFMRMKTEGCAPDDISFIAALKACTSLAMKEDGKLIAGRIVKQASLEKGVVVHNQAVNSGYGSNIRVRNTLIDMYGKCGHALEARKVFDATLNPNTVSWTSMIKGYTDNGFSDQAIELFKHMGREGCTPNALTFQAVLMACSTVVAFQTGKDIHAAVRDQGLENEIASCLVNFYAKCGSMSEAQNVFDSLGKKDLMAWNALMAGYSWHGDTGRVFQLYEQMRSKGVKPDGVTFICVLIACSHAGLVDQGKEYFESMSSEFQVKQEREHYHCMIDTLGRANELKEALSMVEEMPYEADLVTWMTVLGACWKWKNLEVGRIAFDSLIKLDDIDASAYVLMENIYSSLNMWEEQHKIKSMRLGARAWRVPGQSWWTDFAGIVHTFFVGDTSQLKERGYKADMGLVAAGAR